MSTGTIDAAVDPFADLPLADPSSEALRETADDLRGTIAELRDKVTELTQRVEDLEGHLAKAEAEADELRYEIIDQGKLGEEFTQALEALDDLLGLRFLPFPLRQALDDLGARLQARRVIYG